MTDTSVPDILTTARGDRVAYDLRGSGPAVLFVAGAAPYRAIDPTTTTTAELLAAQGLTTVVHDRLGRGGSRVEGRVDLDRELEAVAALVERAGGSAVLVGHSSGCSIALAAAARGIPVDGLVLFEAPFGPEGGDAAGWAAEVDRLLDTGDLEGALVHYMKDIPPELLQGWRDSPVYPDLVAQAGSLRPDAESLVWVESGPLDEVLAGVRVPVEVLVGERTYDEMVVAAQAVCDSVPGATWRRVAGADHEWEPEATAAGLARFVRGLG